MGLYIDNFLYYLNYKIVDLYMKNKKNNIYTKIEELKEDLLKLSHDIHSNPEIKWEEFLAVENISKLLNK